MVLAWVFQVVPDRVARDVDLDPPTGRAYRSIAVLPFVNMCGEHDNEYFSDGMAEELLNALAQIRAAGRGAHVVVRVQGQRQDVARDRAGARGAPCSRAACASGRQACASPRSSSTPPTASTSGPRPTTASCRTSSRSRTRSRAAIVDALQVELGVDAAQPIVIGSDVLRPGGLPGLPARARAFDWSNPARLSEAIGCFQHAVDADPNYAQAWGYLAHATMITPALGHDDAQALATADRAVTRALALDPESWAWRSRRRMIVQLRDHDWVRAGGLYRRALAATDNASAVALYSVLFLPQLGRFDEAFALYREVELRDPLHAGIKTNHGLTLRFAGRSDEAIAKFEEAIAISPYHVFAWSNLILAHLGRGDVAGAEAVLVRIPEALRELPTSASASARSTRAAATRARSRSWMHCWRRRSTCAADWAWSPRSRCDLGRDGFACPCSSRPPNRTRGPSSSRSRRSRRIRHCSGTRGSRLRCAASASMRRPSPRRTSRSMPCTEGQARGPGSGRI